ncbi:CCCH zinc finger protein [Talaromyces stipitatus ATCC 10500]|uniref:CCCH zinc finger protein n=1 Tax=Talaromyces stipitatus (strain ATCC 10500 / CBS 375.48 / QM 6759 / NRRL 1006) TaxID=441959 RepID=B8MQI8_TALSN|nr:CCCH zinc finger protein [Talaromyces stipitatus ATCC 10500]EED13390.1 CCCH zinc finger protein [Talaromyces stipitatus ATCC 10500]
MTEEQELLAKIGQLAGQINQHKNQRQSGPPSNYHSRHPRAGWAPYRGRGATRRPVTHRNRTLILNNTTDASKTPTSETVDNATPPSGSANGWVAKRDRHMQLINSSIYDKEAQARTKAIAETEKTKRERRAKAEEAKVMRYAQGVRNAHVASVPGPNGVATQPSFYQIYIHDAPFQVVRGGSKLIRQNNDPKNANATPKKVVVGGVTFVRSKKGNLHRLGAVVAKRKPSKIKKKNELCKRFSRTGSCYKGPDCPYIHDANKVSICKDFLQTGKCPSGDSCDLSHEPSPHRSPVCVHFLRGRCSNPECRYTHVRVTPGAPVCRAFAILGYCEKGAECTDRHVYECPDYANTGSCKKKKCTLPHVDRAGQLRKTIANKSETTPGEDEEDVSSEEEEYDEIDSDDVDSDELNSDEDEPMVEFVEGGTDDKELSGQQDFVHF